MFLEFINSDFFTQLLGFIGISAGLISFHMKKRTGILILQIICCTLFATQLLILSAYSGAIINIIGIIRGVIYSMKEKYKWANSSAVPLVMIVLFIVTGIISSSAEGLIALAPSGAMTIQSIAQFSKEERRIRLISLFASPLWIIYHIFVGSLAGWIGEIFMVISIILAIATHRKSDTGTDLLAK